MSAVFVDTNVLLYADDTRVPAKRERAQSLLKQIAAEENGYVSIQVLQEYFAAATRKLGLSVDYAQERVTNYAVMSVVRPRLADVLAAIELHRRYKFSIWDALIIRTALIVRCETLYTEDFQNTQRIGSLQIVNPF